jgi:hypothetical protein
MPDVLGAFVRIYFGQHFAAPEFVEAADAGVQVIEFVTGFAGVREIDRQNVGAVDLLDVALLSFGLILFGDVVA